MYAVSLKSADLASLFAEILARGGSLQFEAHGGSMFPFIRDGDVLTVKPVSPKDLRAGDVALYRTAGGGLAVHRVVSRELQDERVVLMLRGDAAPVASERVSAEQVLGQIAYLQRGARIIHLDRNAHRLLAWLWSKLALWRVFGWIQIGNFAVRWLLRKL